MENDLRKRISNAMVVFYDVDTQTDFMSALGRLSVPGAEKLIPNLEKLTDYARQSRYIIAGSVDWHFDGDRELQKNGGPFPDHCMDGHYGQKKIPATNPVCPVYVPNERMKFGKLERLIGDKREIFFEKQNCDVFTNPNAEKILENTMVAVVYGVATDYCVKAAVLGMRKLDIDVFVVEDAIAGVTEESSKTAIREMRDAGAEFVKTDFIIKYNLAEKHLDDLFSGCS